MKANRLYQSRLGKYLNVYLCLGPSCFYFCVCWLDVVGTRNVIDACTETKVKRLICTSSPSVVFDGIHGIFNGDESLPYPEKVFSFLVFCLLLHALLVTPEN